MILMRKKSSFLGLLQSLSFKLENDVKRCSFKTLPVFCYTLGLSFFLTFRRKIITAQK